MSRPVRHSRRALFAITTLALPVVAVWSACAIYDTSLLLPALPEAGPSPPVDPCPHASLPLPPTDDGGADAAAGHITFVAAFKQIARTRDSGPVGYDLDNTCDCTAGVTPLCVPPSPPGDGGPICDDEAGRDDSFASLPLISSLSSDKLSQDLVNGNYGVVLRVSNYNGLPNDDGKISVEMYIAYGVAPFDVDASHGATPTFGPNDGWILAAESLVSRDPGPCTADAAPVACAASASSGRAFVRDGVLAARMESDAPIAFSLGGSLIKLSLAGAIVTGTIVPADGGYAITDGTFAGRAKTQAVLSAVRSIDPSFCTSAGTYQALKKLICANADIPGDPLQQTPTSKPCDALSLAFAFEAVPAKIGGAAVRGYAYQCDAAADDCTQ